MQFAVRLVRTELAADPTNVTYEPLVINHVVLATAVCHCANHKAPAGWRPEDTCMHSFPQSHNERLVSKQSETDHCTPSTIPFGPILDLLLPIINYRRIVLPWCNYCDLHRFCTSMLVMPMAGGAPHRVQCASRSSRCGEMT